jgi:non-heme Fe2+,alpha-ketoglutarate-dependent halogenase
MENTKKRTFALTEEQIKDFRKNGYAGPFTLYEPEEIKNIWKRERLKMLDRSKAVYTDDNSISGGTNIANYDRHLDNEFLANHVCRPEIVHKLNDVFGENVVCWRSEFFPKYPGDEGTDWHQADTFENASGEPQILWPDQDGFGGTLTVWTAFTDTDIDTACLQFIPGTHEEMFYDESLDMEYDPENNNNLEKDGEKRGFFGYDYRNLQKDPSWKPDESKAVSMKMKAGQFIIFWSTLMHASHRHEGKTNNMRLGYVSRYVPSIVNIYPGLDEVIEYGGKISLENYGAVVVSGENTNESNKMRTETTTGIPFKDIIKEVHA